MAKEPTALEQMPHPEEFQPEMDEFERAQLLEPTLARVVLRHHRGFHDFGVPKDDREAIEAATELGVRLSEGYPSSYLPSELVPADPELTAERRRQFDERMGWFEEHGVDARSIARALQLVNILTEDNIEGYRHQLPDDKGLPMLFLWNHSWVADEKHHGIVMQRDAEATGSLWVPRREGEEDSDRPATPEEAYADYERRRATYVYNETSVDLQARTEGRVYPAQQELNTWDPHSSFAVIAGGDSLKTHNTVASDEMRHYAGYRDQIIAELQLALDTEDPEYINYVAAYFIRTLAPKNFEMPAKGRMPEYDTLSKTIMNSGVFDPSSIRASSRKVVKDTGFGDFLENVSDPLVRAAGEEFLEDIQEDSPKAQKGERVLGLVRERKIRDAEKAGELRPFIDGMTVHIHRPSIDGIKPELPEGILEGDDVDPNDRVKIIAA